MSERTLVHLVRHGEVHNPDKVLYGRLDGFHLSDLEYGLRRHHDQLRTLLPVMARASAPAEGEMRSLNKDLLCAVNRQA